MGTSLREVQRYSPRYVSECGRIPQFNARLAALLSGQQCCHVHLLVSVQHEALTDAWSTLPRMFHVKRRPGYSSFATDFGLQ